MIDYMNLSIEERNQIVLNNAKLIPYIIKRYIHISPSNPNYEDLVQEGYIALIKAVERFDPDKGFKFSSYASSLIFGYLQCYIRDCLSPNGIVIPKHIKSNVFKAIKEDKKIDELILEEQLAYKVLTDVHYSFDYEYPSEDGDTITLKEIVADEVSLKTYEEIEMEILLEDFLNYLKSKHKEKAYNIMEEYIYERLNTGDKGYTYEELGQKYGVCRERVRQIIVKLQESFINFQNKD